MTPVKFETVRNYSRITSASDELNVDQVRSANLVHRFCPLCRQSSTISGKTVMTLEEFLEIAEDWVKLIGCMEKSFDEMNIS